MIHCIGNSHVNQFNNDTDLYNRTGTLPFRLHWVGPVIAYHFLQHHMPRIQPVLETISKAKDWITLVVGEVDCRLHIPLQANKQKKEDEVLVKECVERFCCCYDYLQACGFRVFVLGSQPSSPKEGDVALDYVDLVTVASNHMVGNMARRNKIARMWNQALQDYAEKKKLPFVNFYSYLVDEKDQTKMDYFLDDYHLNSKKCWSFIIQELQDKKILSKENEVL